MKYFIYKIKNSNDRDCVAYIDSIKYKNQITNYPVEVEGSCYSCSLESEENQEFFENVMQEEIKYLKNEFYLFDEDIEEIFTYYFINYKDRSIISAIYNEEYIELSNGRIVRLSY